MIADSETGLLFKNKRDRKVLNVDPKVSAAYAYVYGNGAFLRRILETILVAQRYQPRIIFRLSYSII